MRYHLLARTAGRRWWWPLTGTLVVAVGFLAVSIAAGMLMAVAEPATGRGELVELALGFLSIAAFLPATLLAARRVQHRPAGSLSSVTGRLRLRWLLRTCLPVAAAAIVAFLGAGALLDPEELGTFTGWGPFLTATAVLIAVVPLQAAAEEYLCRGWLLQAVGSWLRSPVVPIAVQAVVFAALHGWGTPWGFADLVAFGLIAGWLTVRTGGLEAAVALHVANNLIASVLAAAFGGLYTDETAADMPWQAVALDVPVLIAYAAVILRLARHRNLATSTPPPAGEGELPSEGQAGDGWSDGRQPGLAAGARGEEWGGGAAGASWGSTKPGSTRPPGRGGMHQRAARPASRRAIGTRKGEQET